MQFGRARRTEQPIPSLRSEADDAGKIAAQITKTDRPLEVCDVRTQRAHRRIIFGARIDGNYEENRRRREG
jgi:hypothetical protein